MVAPANAPPLDPDPSVNMQKAGRRTLLSTFGAILLKQIDAEWEEFRDEMHSALATNKVRGAPSDALKSRVEAFERLLAKTHVAILGPGGGDEKLVASVALALHMVRAEAVRTLAIAGGMQDGTRRGKRKEKH